MNKLWLIIKREYLSRVKKKSFILTTILTPLGMVLFIAVASLILSYEGDEKKRVAIIDEGEIVGDLKDESNLYFKFENTPLETLKTQMEEKNYDAILVVPPIKNIQDTRLTVFYYSDNSIGLDKRLQIENKIADRIRKYKIKTLNLDSKQLDILDTRVTINPEPIDENKADSSSMAAGVGAAIGAIMGLSMYMVVFIYGMMVMRSVMEEKTNRIVEVMISSVKPFQLMLGKIIGVGGVGLTQLLIWAILIPSLTLLAQLIFGFDLNSNPELASGGANIDPEEMQGIVEQVVTEIRALNWWVILPLFIIYFLGGYFLYASLFAALGSAIGDDLGESQSLTLPITIPVIIALYISIAIVRSPESSLAVWASIFPLFSPIVMPARLAFSPPGWQVALSIAVLIGTVIFFTWLSGRIYRIGILLYGKKISLKEIGKLLFRKS